MKLNGILKQIQSSYLRLQRALALGLRPPGQGLRRIASRGGGVSILVKAAVRPSP
jgi:hypothetical protein